MTPSPLVWMAADKALTEDTVRPGLIGLVFFVGLFVAVFFLWRSMNKQLRKVDQNFPTEDGGPRSSTRVRIPIVDAAPPATATATPAVEAPDGSSNEHAGEAAGPGAAASEPDHPASE